MQTLTTHKGDTIILIEVSLDAYDFKVEISVDNLDLVYKELSQQKITDYQQTSQVIKDTTENSIIELVGTTSTLTDEGVEPFVESKRIKESWNDTMTTVYLNYNNPNDELIGKYVKLPLESWNSFLQHNGIDLTKNYCVLKLLND